MLRCVRALKRIPLLKLLQMTLPLLTVALRRGQNFRHDYAGAKAEGLKKTVLTELRAVSRVIMLKLHTMLVLLEHGFKDFTEGSRRLSEGGFLGFGGVAVSDAEKATLAEVSLALFRAKQLPTDWSSADLLALARRTCIGFPVATEMHPSKSFFL